MIKHERKRSPESGVGNQNSWRESDRFNVRHSAASRGNDIRCRRDGFTLIEVLASMAVLVVLILALTRMFVEAANITQRGTTALMRNSSGETAMETLLQDTEGMAVNERLACYVEADVADPDGFGFDDVWFITTSGDQDDGRAYQLMHYYVTDSIATNSTGSAYVRFQLMRDMWIMANADRNGIDVMSTNNPSLPLLQEPQVQWWKHDLGRADHNMLADNIVRFDIYALGWDGKEWMGGNAGTHEFDSTLGPLGLEPRNVAPAAFDVYLQITSPQAALEGGLSLLPGMDDASRTRARDLMIRESSTLLGRASPIIGAGQLHHPVEHYAD